MIVFLSLIFISFVILSIKKNKNAIWVLALFIIIFSDFSINSYLGPVVCHDGWASPSIGMQGACSHHGGVDGRGWVLILSIFIAILTITTFLIIKSTIIKLKNKETTLTEINHNIFNTLKEILKVIPELVLIFIMGVLTPLFMIVVAPLAFLFETIKDFITKKRNEEKS